MQTCTPSNKNTSSFYKVAITLAYNSCLRYNEATMERTQHLFRFFFRAYLSDELREKTKLAWPKTRHPKTRKQKTRMVKKSKQCTRLHAVHCRFTSGKPTLNYQQWTTPVRVRKILPTLDDYEVAQKFVWCAFIDKLDFQTLRLFAFVSANGPVWFQQSPPLQSKTN